MTNAFTSPTNSAHDIYKSYCAYHKLISPETEPLAFAQWNCDTYAEEIKRHEKDVFLASMHPDGSNLAGFHGVTGEYEDA